MLATETALYALGVMMFLTFPAPYLLASLYTLCTGMDAISRVSWSKRIAPTRSQRSTRRWPTTWLAAGQAPATFFTLRDLWVVVRDSMTKVQSADQTARNDMTKTETT
ncbi:hypothetical protein SPRG_10823 [Saprolegnia parasitica CBS 223.65]|uniref:Uncharacterized protein n=1 Tax=Saprolegnia parasitica (strain CBS 223.65) TaxID=695850 RepID=A0A067C4G4_SAPPC|nr:hypothetical protein SPRG_10823 [Saprolegnia parasitica CBS 223.65]KDO24035.1 hypothetical protein SPRG_10823 [Saprolegnia parasitica CBS 223.65]|eukprot:XP_012205172.1 hypothetical protein SPRG_10823 [Saprolegnia parasitica CBS 223.65]